MRKDITELLGLQGWEVRGYETTDEGLIFHIYRYRSRGYWCSGCGEVARNWLSLIPFIAVSVGTCGNFNGERFKYFGIAMLVILAVISSMTEVTFCFWI